MTSQEKFEQAKNKIIEILTNMKLEADPHFIFISQNEGHKSEVRMITRSCPDFMAEQSIQLAKTAVEEENKDNLTSGLNNLN